MKIQIISSSTRTGSESRNVSEYIKSIIESKDVGAQVTDLSELRLPLYDNTNEGEWKEELGVTKSELTKSDGLVFVSPEWDGMMSAGLHNFFHYLDQELADKPVYLVGVSSGRGGRYPLIQMRQMGYKNRHFVVIPESIFIDDVKNNLSERVMQNEHISKRLNYGLDTLIAYAEALKQVRASGLTNYKDFPNGW